MMRFLFVIAYILGPSTVFAKGNPWQRVCRVAGGQQWVLNIDDPQNEKPLCVFDQAAISSETLFNYTTQKQISLALQAYLREIGTCAEAGGQVGYGLDSDGMEYYLCEFSDSSFIEMETLSRGKHDPANAKLNQGLVLY